MEIQAKQIVLFTSSSTPQYEKDICNVIALPENGQYHFRYRTNYIDENIKLKSGMNVLIAYRTNFSKENKIIQPFIVPLRYAEIKGTYHFASMVLIDFIVKGYPAFSEIYKEKCTSENSLVNYSKDLIDNDQYYVTSINPSKLISESRINENKQEELWYDIISALSLDTTTFKNRLFFISETKLSPVTGCLSMKENKPCSINIAFNNSDPHRLSIADINIIFDNTLLISTLGNQDTIESRYDRREYSFMPKTLNSKVKTTIKFIISIHNNDSSIPKTEIKYPVVIKHSIHWKSIVSSVLSFAGATLVGINAVLKIFLEDTSSFPLWIGIGFLVIGSISIAIANYISGR